MRFKGYQAGGAIYTPFISNRGVSQAGQQTTSDTKSSSKTDKASDAIQKEIIDILKENGLQNDVNKFLETANTFLTKSRNLSSMSLFGGEEDEYTMSHLISILQMANGVKRNKGQYDLATANLKEQHAGNEAAIATNGYLYVIDKDYKMSTVSPEEFYKNRDKYQSLTNSQVLGLREQDPNLAYNTNILDDVSGAIGMKVITDQLTDIITKFGSISRTEYVKKTGDNISQKTWDGIQLLINNGPNGYYKATTKSEKESLNSAALYLWNAIGANGQKKLAATAAISGLDPHKNKYDIIMQALDLHTDYSQDVNFDKSATDFDPDGDSKGNSGSTPKYVEQTRAERYASGNGFGNSQWFPILSADKSTPMYVSAQNLGPVLNKDEKTLFGDANLEEVLNEAYGVGGIVDRSSITFGEIPVTWDDASKIMFESGSNMYRALIPARRDSTGRLRPDFELQAKVNHLNSTLQNMSSDSIKQSIADVPEVRYNETTGMIEAVNVAPFIVLQGAASTDTFGGELKNAKYLHNLTSEEDRRKKSKYNIITGSRAVYGGGEKRQDTGNPKTTWWMGYQFFEGNVFIPINDSIIAAAVYNDQLVPQDTYINMSAKEQARQEYQQRQQTVDELLQSGNLRFNF